MDILTTIQYIEVNFSFPTWNKQDALYLRLFCDLFAYVCIITSFKYFVLTKEMITYLRKKVI